MHLISGEGGDRNATAEPYTTQRYGELGEVMTALEINTESSFSGAFEDLGMSPEIALWLRNSLGQSFYRIVEGESTATDFRVVFAGNLPEQLAQARGQDLVRIHTNIFADMKAAADQTAEAIRDSS